MVFEKGSKHAEEEPKGEGKEEVRKEPESKAEAQASPNEYAELRDKFLRLAAEFDNYKKRVKVEIDSSKAAGKAELIKDLLSVLDEFEIALVALKQVNDVRIVSGFELLYSNFLDTLRKAGLKEVTASGVFDPYMHEIIMVEEDSSKKPGTILQVMKKGYMLGSILLRPASVTITKEPEEHKEEKT